jgi:uncharacterized protein YcbK (DUF882 family)
MNRLLQWLLSLFQKSADPNQPVGASVTVPITSTGYTKPKDKDSTIRKNDIQLTKFFSLFELTHTDHAELQEANRDLTDEQIKKLTLLAELLETIRDIIGMSIIVDDAYRSLALNKATGGVANSQHELCEAADVVFENTEKKAIRAINDLYPLFKKIWDAIKAGKLKVGQAIFEEKTDGTSWIHISMGTPYRDAGKCGQIMIKRGGNYELLEQIKVA